MQEEEEEEERGLAYGGSFSCSFTHTLLAGVCVTWSTCHLDTHAHTCLSLPAQLPPTPIQKGKEGWGQRERVNSVDSMGHPSE